jgi:hypothetical protein
VVGGESVEEWVSEELSSEWSSLRLSRMSRN